jgi:hypothetical protein
MAQSSILGAVDWTRGYRWIWASLLLIPVTGAYYCNARVEVGDRMVEFHDRVAALGVERGLFLPTEARIEEQVRGIASELELTITDLQVAIRPLGPGNMHAAPLGTQIVHDRLTGMPTSGGGHLEHTAVLIWVRAHVVGTHWPYTEEREVETSRTVGHELHRR